MQTKIKTITEIDTGSFDKAVNEFTKDKRVVAAQTHVNFFINSENIPVHMFTAVIYYQE